MLTAFQVCVWLVSQNCGPFLGTLNIRCRIILRTQKGTIILTTTRMRSGGCQCHGYILTTMAESLPRDLEYRHSAT